MHITAWVDIAEVNQWIPFAVPLRDSSIYYAAQQYIVEFVALAGVLDWIVVREGQG